MFARSDHSWKVASPPSTRHGAYLTQKQVGWGGKNALKITAPQIWVRRKLKHHPRSQNHRTVGVGRKHHPAPALSTATSILRTLPGMGHHHFLGHKQHPGARAHPPFPHHPHLHLGTLWAAAGSTRTIVHQLGEFQAEPLLDFPYFPVHGEGLDI